MLTFAIACAALALSAGPAIAAEPQTYAFTDASDLKYTVRHMLHTIEGTAHGDLTLHGVTRPIAIPVTGWALPFDAHLTARFAVSLAAHGVPAPRLFFIPVDDRVEIEVEAVARRTGR